MKLQAEQRAGGDRLVVWSLTHITESCRPATMATHPVWFTASTVRVQELV